MQADVAPSPCGAQATARADAEPHATITQGSTETDVHKVVITLPAWAARLEARSLAEYDHVLAFVVRTRAALALLLLVAWPCAVGAKWISPSISSRLQCDNPVVAPALNWGLAFGLIAWLYCCVYGVCASAWRSRPASRRLADIVTAGVFADLPLAFLAMSAATALEIAAPMAGNQGRAAATLMWLAFLAFLVAAVLSLVVFRGRHLVAQSQLSPAVAAAAADAAAEVAADARADARAVSLA